MPVVPRISTLELPLFLFFFRKEVRALNTTLLIVLVTVLVVAVIALVREVRLRRALQALLRRLLSRWRRHNVEDSEERIGRDDGRGSQRL